MMMQPWGKELFWLEKMVGLASLLSYCYHDKGICTTEALEVLACTYLNRCCFLSDTSYSMGFSFYFLGAIVIESELQRGKDIIATSLIYKMHL